MGRTCGTYVVWDLCIESCGRPTCSIETAWKAWTVVGSIILKLFLNKFDVGSRIIFSFPFFAWRKSPPPPPNGPGSFHYRGFTITHNDTPQLLGLLWTSDRPVAKTPTWQHTRLAKEWDIHAVGGGFEPAISTGWRPQTHALDLTATLTSVWRISMKTLTKFRLT